jgi:hypothetical protein
MPGVVLPIRISSAIRGDIISVNVYVSIEIVIVVDVDVVATPAAAPTPTATPSCPHSYADPERDRHPCGIISRRRVVNRGIGIQWTTDLGNAFLAQQSDVMDAVQRMRKKAQEKGNLKSNEQQKVETKVVENKSVIVVEQANPQVVYVPSYSPVVVYGAPVIIRQSLYDIGQRCHRLDAWIPRLLCHRIHKFFVFQFLIFFKPLLQLDDF